MNQLNHIYQELGVREVDLDLEDRKLEHQSKREPLLCKDGGIEKYRRTMTLSGIKKSFWSRVRIKGKNKCWEWTGFVKDKKWNYGIVGFNNKFFKTHRLAYLLSKGPIKNVCVCHKCDNPICCNPHHLFSGNRKDNNKDCLKKGRTLKGSNHPRSKLNEEDIYKIRELNKIMIHQEIADLFKVKRATISYILSGKNWGHLK